MATSAQQGPRRRPARRGEGERLRGEIVQAALDLLAESGDTTSLSLRSIARRVGVAPTSIYLHFPDLDALVHEVKTRLFDRLVSSADLDPAHAGDAPLDRVVARAHAYVEFGMAEPGLYRVMFASPMLPPGYLAEGAYIGQPAFEALRADVAEVCGPAVADLVSVHVWTALHGVVTLRTARTAFPWPEMREQVDDLVHRLVGPPPTPRARR